jgi:general secretion pathway protein G
MNKKQKTNLQIWKQGFTLIELLIVIAIIGVLTSISVFALSGSRQSARDTKRKTDLEQIRSALEIYKSDCSRYPASLTFNSTLVGNGTNCPAANTYMQLVPQDTVSGRNYAYKATGSPATSYVICASLEDTAGAADPRCTAASLSCGGTCNYSVISP